MPLLDADCYPKPGALFTLDSGGYIWPIEGEIHSFSLGIREHYADSGAIVMFIETINYREVLRRNGYNYDDLPVWDRDAGENEPFWTLLIGEKTTYLSFTNAILNLTAVNRSAELPQET